MWRMIQKVTSDEDDTMDFHESSEAIDVTPEDTFASDVADDTVKVVSDEDDTVDYRESLEAVHVSAEDAFVSDVADETLKVKSDEDDTMDSFIWGTSAAKDCTVDSFFCLPQARKCEDVPYDNIANISDSSSGSSQCSANEEEDCSSDGDDGYFERSYYFDAHDQTCQFFSDSSDADVEEVEDKQGDKSESLGSVPDCYPSTSETQLPENSFESAFVGEIASFESESATPSAAVDLASLKNDLQELSFKHGVTHACMNDILSVLRHHFQVEVPKDARTLLSTPRSCVKRIKIVGNGTYIHLGLRQGLEEKLGSGVKIVKCENDVKYLSIATNVDGMLVSKSGAGDLWPILCRVIECHDDSPFMVGAFYGTSKPTPLEDYFEDFINEAKEMCDEGFVFEGEKWHLCLDGPIICDVPAKAHVKGIKAFSGHYGCDRCVQKGVWNGRMTYPAMNAPLRTDESFRNQTQKQHHKSLCPLLVLPIDSVMQFVLDYMHLCCLGVMRRLIMWWMKVGLKAVRLNQIQINTISSMLEDFQKFVPQDFARRPRSLKYVKKFKATEFRQILLYLGVVVFRGIVKKELYEHFLLLYVALRILTSPVFASSKDHVDYAEKVLHKFVKECHSFYGVEMLVYNIHALLHICDDVRRYGPLDAFSAFPFENYLGKVRKDVRTPHKPLQQIICRNMERKKKKFQPVEGDGPIPSQKHCSGPTQNMSGDQNRVVRLGNTLLSVKEGDNVVCIHGKIVLISNFIQDFEAHIHVIGSVFTTVSDFFQYPCNSSQLGVFRVDYPLSLLRVWRLDEIDFKCVSLPYEGGFVVQPLLHTSLSEL